MKASLVEQPGRGNRQLDPASGAGDVRQVLGFVGFRLGGATPFLIGDQAFNPPPPPPGEAPCGNGAMSGLCVMVFRTRFGALVGTFMGWLVGVSLVSGRLKLSRHD